MKTKLFNSEWKEFGYKRLVHRAKPGPEGSGGFEASANELAKQRLNILAKHAPEVEKQWNPIQEEMTAMVTRGTFSENEKRKLMNKTIPIFMPLAKQLLNLYRLNIDFTSTDFIRIHVGEHLGKRLDNKGYEFEGKYIDEIVIIKNVTNLNDLRIIGVDFHPDGTYAMREDSIKNNKSSEYESKTGKTQERVLTQKERKGMLDSIRSLKD
jgi:hypothetical protein